MAHIFISYSHDEDGNKARQICEFLEAQRGPDGPLACWMAYRNISPGENYADAIMRGIKQCRLLLLLLTPDSNDSPYVRLELCQAVDHRKPILTLRTNPQMDLAPTVRFLIGLSQMLDVPGSIQEYLPQIYKAVLHIIGSEPGLEDSRTLAGVPAAEFWRGLVGDYRKNLDKFFDPETGAVREQDRDDGTPGFLFSEATGYAIADLLLLHSITGESAYLSSAARAADWLTTNALTSTGWIRPRFFFDRDDDPHLTDLSFSGGRIYSFDNGICLTGLVALQRAQPAQARLCRIRTLAGNLVGCVLQNGRVPAILDASGREIRFENPRWSQLSGAFHAKVAEALTVAAGMLPGEAITCRETALKICQHAVTFQEPDGRFRTGARDLTQLHPHCYAAEGLLQVGLALKQPQFVESARSAVEWALSQCLGDGAIPQEFSARGPVDKKAVRYDAVAQVLRLCAQLMQSGELDDRWWPSVENLARAVWKAKDPGSGHFRYGSYENGHPSTTLSYWTNGFAFHSLIDYAAALVCRKTIAVVLAGGIGSRCWPISCERVPKPLSRGFLGERSLLETTVARILSSGCVLPSNLYVSTTSTAVGEARRQMAAFRVPRANVIDEGVPKGTAAGLRHALQTIGRTEKELLLVSMADNIIEPHSAFRDNLIRAALAAWAASADVLVTLAIRSDKWDRIFGHAIYDERKLLLEGVHEASGFVEKPNEPLPLRERQRIAWEGGCIVGRAGYIGGLLGVSKPGAPLSASLARHILSDSEVRKAASLYSPVVRFADLGTPGDDLRRFFAQSPAARGAGNVFLGPADTQSVFLKARRNFVISDHSHIEVIGLEDHLIIDNLFTNAAVCVPLDKVGELPALYRRYLEAAELKPYTLGGPEAQRADARFETVQCQGRCRADSSEGLAVAAHCSNLTFTRKEVDGGIRVRAVDEKYIHLDDDEVELLLSKKSDPRLVRHLVDVAVVAECLAEQSTIPTGSARKLLRLFCLTHDIGGFLTDEEIVTERELAAMISRSWPDLNWKILDSRVVERLILTEPPPDFREEHRRLLESFHDSTQSAVHVLENAAIRSNRHFQELLYLLTQQDFPTNFRRPIAGTFGMTVDVLVKIYACFEAAEIWANAHSLWKNSLLFRPRGKEDVATFAALIWQRLSDADVDPSGLVETVYALLSSESPFRKYTCDELRVCDEGLCGETQKTPLYPSDTLFLRFLDVLHGRKDMESFRHALDSFTGEMRLHEIEEEIAAGKLDGFQTLELIIRLPSSIEKLRAHQRGPATIDVRATEGRNRIDPAPQLRELAVATHGFLNGLPGTLQSRLRSSGAVRSLLDLIA